MRLRKAHISPCRIGCPPVARAGAVIVGKGVVDPDTQGGQEGQPRDQYPATETDSRQLTVLDSSGHRSHIDTEYRGGLGDRHDGGSADLQLVEIHARTPAV
jgi:hypothetical protein